MRYRKSRSRCLNSPGDDQHCRRDAGKWRDTLEDIDVQIPEMYLHRMIWRELVRLVEKGAHPHRCPP